MFLSPPFFGSVEQKAQWPAAVSTLGDLHVNTKPARYGFAAQFSRLRAVMALAGKGGICHPRVALLSTEALRLRPISPALRQREGLQNPGGKPSTASACGEMPVPAEKYGCGNIKLPQPYFCVKNTPPFARPHLSAHHRSPDSCNGKLCKQSFCVCRTAFSGFPNDRLTSRVTDSSTYSNGSLLRILTGFPHPRA